MKRPIPIGIEFYKQMIDRNYCYVDKTLLIRDILDNGAFVSLFTRPRRFGKTLALSMLKVFFEDERDDLGNRIDNRHYFDGKKIAACGEKYMEKQGQYPVISLTLKSAKQPDFETAHYMLCSAVKDEYIRHSYILQEEHLPPDYRERFRNMAEGRAKEKEYAGALGISLQGSCRIPSVFLIMRKIIITAFCLGC